MTYLITGATGNIGGRVIERLLERGERPRILVRDPEKARERYGKRVDIAVGDLSDATSLASAFAGVDAILLIKYGSRSGDSRRGSRRRREGCRRQYVVKLSSKDARAGSWNGAMA